MRLGLPVVILATLAVSAQERPSEQGVNFYSRENEAALGAQLAQEVRRSTNAVAQSVAVGIEGKLGPLNTGSADWERQCLGNTYSRLLM